MSSKDFLAKCIEQKCLFRIKQMYLLRDGLLRDGETRIPSEKAYRRTLEIDEDEDFEIDNFINKRVKLYKLPIMICKSIINNNINQEINKVIIERFNEELFDLMDTTRTLAEKDILNEREYLSLCNQYKTDRELVNLLN